MLDTIWAASRSRGHHKNVQRISLLIFWFCLTVFCCTLIESVPLKLPFQRKHFPRSGQRPSVYPQQRLTSNNDENVSSRSSGGELSAKIKEDLHYTSLVKFKSTTVLAATKPVAEHNFVYNIVSNMASRVYIDSVIDYEMTTIFQLFLYILWNEIPYRMYGGFFLLVLRQSIMVKFEGFVREIILVDWKRVVFYRFVFSMVMSFYNKFAGLLVLVYQNVLFSTHVTRYKKSSWRRRIFQMIEDPFNLLFIYMKYYRSIQISSMLPALMSFWESSVATFLDSVIFGIAKSIRESLSEPAAGPVTFSLPDVAKLTFLSKTLRLVIILPSLNAIRHIFRRFKLPASIYLNIFDDFFDTLVTRKVLLKKKVAQSKTRRGSRSGGNNGDASRERISLTSSMGQNMLFVIFRGLLEVLRESGVLFGWYRNFWARLLTLTFTVPIETIGIPISMDTTKNIINFLRTHTREELITIMKISPEDISIFVKNLPANLLQSFDSFIDCTIKSWETTKGQIEAVYKYFRNLFSRYFP